MFRSQAQRHSCDRQLVASRFLDRRAFEIGRKIVRLECLDAHLDQADKWTSEIGPVAAGTIHHHPNGRNNSAAPTDDVDRFLNTPSARHHIFGDDESFARCNLKTAPQHQSAPIFFGENVALAQRAPDFLVDDDSAERRRNHRIALNGIQFFCETSANIRDNPSVLEQERALKILPAVQPGTQDKMTIKQRAGFAKKREQIVAHFVLRSARVHPGAFRFLQRDLVFATARHVLHEASGFGRSELQDGTHNRSSVAN